MADPAKVAVRVRVWDLPTRIFHGLLAVLVTAALATGHAGGNWMPWHQRLGCGVLALVAFRLAWGAVGGCHARFSSFVHGPAAVWRHALALTRGEAPRHLGHNPMGGWSVLAMLAAVMVQAVSGLFANDDIFTEGPLYPWVSKAASDLITRVHRVNQEVVIALVILHLGAVFIYLIFKKDNLIGPMITGVKHWHEAAPPTDERWRLASVIAALSAVGVYLLAR